MATSLFQKTSLLLVSVVTILVQVVRLLTFIHLLTQTSTTIPFFHLQYHYGILFHCQLYLLHLLCLLSICDRIWENPPYGINAQFAQCAFLVPLVRNCQSSDFVIYMSKNLSSSCYRRLRRLGVTYQGEISLY